MQIRTAVLAASVLSVAASAEANFWRYSYANAGNAWYSSITAEYQPGTKRFKWDFTANSNVNGFWLVVSPGPNPKGNAGELAILYLDAKTLTANSTITPRLTIYNYNGTNGTNSWLDGNAAVAGNQTPDRIFSSQNANASSVITQLTATDNGTNTNSARRFTVELDASIIQNHTPLYPASNGDPWTGVAFANLLGAWFHPTSGTNTSYGTNAASPDFNYLTNFSYAGQAAFDTTNLATQWVPAPGALALLGLAGVVGAGRRRK